MGDLESSESNYGVSVVQYHENASNHHLELKFVICGTEISLGQLNKNCNIRIKFKKR